MFVDDVKEKKRNETVELTLLFDEDVDRLWWWWWWWWWWSFVVLLLFFCRFDVDDVLLMLSVRAIFPSLTSRRFSDESCRLCRLLRWRSMDELVCRLFRSGGVDELQTHAHAKDFDDKHARKKKKKENISVLSTAIILCVDIKCRENTNEDEIRAPFIVDREDERSRWWLFFFAM